MLRLNKNFNTYFFFTVLVGISILAFMLFRPFLTAIVVAAALATLFEGAYQKILTILKNKTASSLLVVTVIFFLVVIPLSIGGGIVMTEASKGLTWLSTGGYENAVATVVNVVNKIPGAELFKLEERLAAGNIGALVKTMSQTFFDLAGKTYESAASLMLWIVIMQFTLFYFLIEGKRIIRKIIYLSPLKNEQEELLISKFIAITHATLKGTLIVGFVQGVIAMITFLLLGIPSAFLWGIVMIIASTIPLLGPSIIWLPTSLILLFTGSVWQGVVLLTVGVCLISTIDNMLRPRLVGKEAQIHPLLVFFATIGGLSVFGFSGFIIGPIIMALALTLWEIYAKEFKDDLASCNEEELHIEIEK